MILIGQRWTAPWIFPGFFAGFHPCQRVMILDSRVLILCLTSLVSAVSMAEGTASFPITAYGADRDESKASTEAIRRAVEAAHAAGGGTVLIPAGRWLSGTVFLKSNVTLHLAAGATLLASREEADYPRNPADQAPALIRAENVSRVGITGPGVIDGQARQVWAQPSEVDSFIAAETELARQAGIDMKRAVTLKPNPGLVHFSGCSDVLIEKSSFLNSAFWSVHLGNCERVSVRDVRIETSLDMGVNADGLDIDGCRDVRVSGCTIATGDDAICLKSTRIAGGKPCTDIVVTGCVLASTSCALKIGTETFGDFQRIVFSDCVIRNSNRGIGIFVRDGAAVRDVLFSNLVIDCGRKHYHWWGDGDPLRFVVLKRNPASKTGSIRRVLVSNVIATGEGTSLIAGLTDSDSVSDITLRDVRITMKAESTADKRATHGLIVRDAADVTLDGVRLAWDRSAGVGPRWGEPLFTERAPGLSRSNCRFDPAPP